MLKALIVFCAIGVEPCTESNATYVIRDLSGSYAFPHLCQLANIKRATTASKKRGNGEYFKILCVPAEGD